MPQTEIKPDRLLEEQMLMAIDSKISLNHIIIALIAYAQAAAPSSIQYQAFRSSAV